ncbi:branched-chain amino acid ABC transporter permease [Bradyrhizobium sp. CCGUVB1N3]|uniref:branched-chain amino acid ABC transporter permease n=1 Tax=Bradyrhizobium sp. CCGUVB1N3 TaxID=2949629 RepID=UPI0020B29017|nr:branched-chain amino acid ABC transporter permease [Bradyrhizobium sp. CCGUVB1N3]MCP3471755.1 branched-chain amino acid ABC transporter permease [Bradyrhizobium sp. CCGUVB1N3]
MEQAVVTAVGVFFSISTLVLLALGLAIIFGMMGVLNLAQGEFLTLGAYTVLVATSHGLSIWAGVLLAPFVVGSIGVILERSIIRFLYGRPLDTMLATWGLSLALVGVMTLVMGPTTEGIATPLGSFEVGRYRVSFYRLVVIAISAGAALATYLALRHTRAGLIARATMQSPHLVAVSGVEPQLVYMATFGAGAALAGLAGAVMAPLTGVVPTMGLAFIAKIFITVMVGGSTVLLGTVSSAGVLGLVESAVSYASTPIYGQVTMLALAMVLLRLLPNGMSGLFRGGL